MNYPKVNLGKSQLLLTSKGESSIKTDDTDIKSSSSRKLLEAIINSLLRNMLLSFAKKQVINYRCFGPDFKIYD